MRETSPRVSLLFLAAVLLACSQSPSTPAQSNGGSGGRASGGSSGSGGSGGSGGNTPTGGSATGGGVGSGGSAGGASAASGGSTGRGGATGVGGSEPGGAGGSEPGGAGGSEPGGAGGAGTGGTKSGGSGGTSPGGAGGQSSGDGSVGGTGGTTDDGGPDSGNGGATTDATPGSSCTDKKTNGDETDVDCGGGTCPKCGASQKCKVDDDCRGGKCDTGKCADPFAATGTITSNGNIWKITMGTLTMEVDAAIAGRVSTLTLDAADILVKNNGNSTGSVFWPAPQADWNANGWPPPDEFETKGYAPTSKDNILVMTGPAGTTGISVTKRYWGNTERQAVTIEYTIKNGGSAEVKLAPWEISRVYPGGLTFFPNAEPPALLGMQYSGFVEVPFTSTEGGVLWWKYKTSEFTQNAKSGADGLEGWAAHVVCGTGLEKTCSKSPVLIKQWPDQSTPAPKEREVEIYADAGHTYVEFEQQGAYAAIPAGGTVVWTMHWMLRYLPTNITPTPGSAELVSWVRGQLL